MKSFYIGVKAIVVHDGKILLLKRIRNGKYFWDGPGGRVEANEELESAIKRELAEELQGIHNITVEKLLYIYRLPHDLKDNHGLLRIFYKITADISHISLEPAHEEYIWIEKDKIDEFFVFESDHIDGGIEKAVRMAVD